MSIVTIADHSENGQQNFAPKQIFGACAGVHTTVQVAIQRNSSYCHNFQALQYQRTRRYSRYVSFFTITIEIKFHVRVEKLLDFCFSTQQLDFIFLRLNYLSHHTTRHSQLTLGCNNKILFPKCYERNRAAGLCLAHKHNKSDHQRPTAYPGKYLTHQAVSMSIELSSPGFFTSSIPELLSSTSGKGRFDGESISRRSWKSR